MTTYLIKFVLQTDATFGRGDGVAGLVDEEVEHDEYGLPFLRGRTLKGLIAEECANILYALQSQGKNIDRWSESSYRLFGQPGSSLKDDAFMHVGDARLPKDIQDAVRSEIEKKKLTPVQILDSLTDIRRQTAINEKGAPEEGSLRSIRVVLRRTPFEAELTFSEDPTDDDLALLTSSILAFRRAGTSRNRGRGLLKATLWHGGKDITDEFFEHFQKEVLK